LCTAVHNPVDDAETAMSGVLGTIAPLLTGLVPVATVAAGDLDCQSRVTRRKLVSTPGLLDAAEERCSTRCSEGSYPVQDVWSAWCAVVRQTPRRSVARGQFSCGDTVARWQWRWWHWACRWALGARVGHAARCDPRRRSRHSLVVVLLAALVGGLKVVRFATTLVRRFVRGCMAFARSSRLATPPSSACSPST